MCAFPFGELPWPVDCALYYILCNTGIFSTHLLWVSESDALLSGHDVFIRWILWNVMGLLSLQEWQTLLVAPPVSSSFTSRKSDICQITKVSHFWKSLTSFPQLWQSLCHSLAIDRWADVTVWAVTRELLKRDFSSPHSSTDFVFALFRASHLARRSST